jgi:hypothetical protein
MAILFPLKLQTAAIGKVFDGFSEVLLEQFLDESEAIAAGSTGMALVEVIPLVGDNGEGGILVIMERTEPHVLSALGLQHDMLSNEYGQISLIAHSVDIRLFKKHDYIQPALVPWAHLHRVQAILESSLKSFSHEVGCHRHPAGDRVQLNVESHGDNDRDVPEHIRNQVDADRGEGIFSGVHGSPK